MLKRLVWKIQNKLIASPIHAYLGEAYKVKYMVVLPVIVIIYQYLIYINGAIDQIILPSEIRLQRSIFPGY